jgi:putative intracellular protease/amidase
MKVLMVLTCHDRFGDTGRKTGFWQEELAAPYDVFKDTGAQITLSLDPNGEDPRFRSDRHFEKDTDAELDKTMRVESVKQEDCDTGFFPGGHG